MRQTQPSTKPRRKIVTPAPSTTEGALTQTEEKQLTELSTTTTTDRDPVFTDERVPEDNVLAKGEDTSKKDAKRAKENVNFFKEAAKEEKDREAGRLVDRQIGQLIGPKNLEKLRGFGFDVVLVNNNRMPLTPGTSHRGMTT